MPKEKNKSETVARNGALKQKLSLLQKIFMIIGIITTIFIALILLLLLALVIIKPFGINILKIPSAITNEPDTDNYDHPLLTPQQENILESIGIDTQNIPTQITPTQEKCLKEELGTERVNDIIAGSPPSVNDYLKAGYCFD